METCDRASAREMQFQGSRRWELERDFDEVFNKERAMLVLSRKLGQRFHVGNDVRVTIVKIDRNSVRIGVEAPNSVNVYREEIIHLNKDQAVEVGST